MSGCRVQYVRLYNDFRRIYADVWQYLEDTMRKKSHISLAGYLVRELRLEELVKHKKAFYLGSILPDLTPKMITSPHEYMTSYEKLRESICYLSAEGESGEYNERVLWRRIGVVMHYLADYFTFPHNVSYEGNLKDHCLYEREMKYWLRSYVRTPEAKMIFRRQREEVRRMDGPKALLDSIERTHFEYMCAPHTVEDDCVWIVMLCSRVLLYFAAVVSGELLGEAVFCAA